MKMNRKGSLGFPEAIMALMVVTLALTAYLGVLAFDQADRETGAPEIDRSIFKDMRIENGEVVGDISAELERFAERNGCKGVLVRCNVPGNMADGAFEIKIGSMDGHIVSESFILTLGSDDGRKIPVVFEAATCS